MTTQRFKLLTLLLASATGALSLPVLAEDKPAEIRIVYPGAGTGGKPSAELNFYATAAIQGALEDEFRADGIKVKWTFFPGAGPAVNESTANGLVDFSLHGDLPAIVGRSTGLKHKVVLSGGRFGNAYLVVPTDSTARSLADLKGKRIAVFKGTANQLTLGRILERNGLNERDFKTIAMDTETSKAALATRDIDGWVTAAPFDLQARGIARVLAEYRDDPKVNSPTSIWVTDEFERKYPQIVQRVVTRLVKTAKWATDEKNRDQVFREWAKAGNYSYVDFTKDWAGTPLKGRINPLLDEYYLTTIKSAVEDAKRYKLIRRDVDVDSWVERKYLTHALKELKLEGFWPEYDASGKIKSGKL